MIELRVPKRLPSLNGFVKLHWSQYRRQRKAWTQAVWVAKVQAGVVGAPKLARVRLEIERHAGRPILDEDNLEAGAKFLMDALVECGLLLDDSSRVIVERPRIVQVKVPTREARTVVRIYPLQVTAGSGA